MDNIASGVNATVVGGDNNDAIGNQSSVFGGRDNTAAGIASTASGGIMNAAVGQQATAIGGSNNYVVGTNATAVGGLGRDYANGEVVYDSAVRGSYSVGIAGGSTGENAIGALAAGHQAVVTTENGTAIGYQAIRLRRMKRIPLLSAMMQAMSPAIPSNGTNCPKVRSMLMERLMIISKLRNL